MRLRVRKWYLDCSTADEVIAFAYAGEASVGWIRFFYFELLVRGADGGDYHRQHVSAREVASLIEAPHALTISAPMLGVTGQWAGPASDIRATLADAPTRIAWRCVRPAADVSLTLPGGRELTGRGYAEYLSVDGDSSADLPFRRIRWGRFIGGPHHAIWIDWAGDASRRWVWADGVPVQASEVSEHVVVWPRGRVDVDAGITLRDGSITDTIGGRIGRWLPRRLVGARETKWSGPARLTGPDGVTHGRAVHEIVTWP